LYDGSVCVYDIRSKNNKPIYQSFDPKIKHTDPCWQVYWQPEQPTKNTNFFSISTDGRVTNWIMNKNELVNEEVIELKLSQKLEEDEKAEHSIVGAAGGCCMDFNKDDDNIFVVGTEEGAIHKYSKAYNSQLLQTFEGHHMAVYAVKWNPFHPDVFLSCSADWTVKLWEANTPTPLMTFDLNTSVGDVAWAPFSSTVFAVITNDGKLRLFDLSVSKNEAIGEFRVNKKAKLTHLCFNPKEPVLCVGDDRGVINILKLSSNLRKIHLPSTGTNASAAAIAAAAVNAPSLNPTFPTLPKYDEIERLNQLLIINHPDGTVTRLSDLRKYKKEDKKKHTKEKKADHKEGESGEKGHGDEKDKKAPSSPSSNLTVTVDGQPPKAGRKASSVGTSSPQHNKKAQRSGGGRGASDTPSKLNRSNE